MDKTPSMTIVAGKTFLKEANDYETMSIPDKGGLKLRISIDAGCQQEGFLSLFSTQWGRGAEN